MTMEYGNDSAESSQNRKLGKRAKSPQKEIINTARRMSDEGAIVLAGRGGDDFV